MTPVRTVRAARLVAHGQPPELHTVELAVGGDAEATVEMSFSGVNPVDRYVALGRIAPQAALPRTLGVEGVGTLDGHRVLVHGSGLGTERDGLWAEAAVVPVAAAVDVPDGVASVEAAAMGVAGATAWRTVTELAAVGPHDRVLVLGASGGVGSMIVSLTSAIGATVWGQTGRDDKAAFVREMGAVKAVVASSAAGLPAAVAELSPTVVFDPLGADFTGAAIEALDGHGRLVLFGTSAGAEGRAPLQALYRKGLSVLGYGGLAEPPEAVRRGMEGALEALRDGRLRVAVHGVVGLGEVGAALERLGDRSVRGKLVLDTGRSWA